MKPEHRPNYANTVSHIREFINPREAKKIVEMSVRHLRRLEAEGLEFTTIAFRGLSGALIAPMIAMEMDKSLLAIRKVKRTGHGSNPVEGDYNAKNYIIVDDFIHTGETCREIMREVADCYSIRYNDHNGAKCVGVLQAYYLQDPDNCMREMHGHYKVFDTLLSEEWNEDYAYRMKEKQRQEQESREESQRNIDKLRKSSDRCEVSMGDQTWGTYVRPDWDLFRMPETLGLDGLLRYVGLPAPKEPSPLKKYVATEKARLAKLKSDRDNFNARTPTGRQQSFPRITSSLLRNISR